MILSNITSAIVPQTAPDSSLQPHLYKTGLNIYSPHGHKFGFGSPNDDHNCLDPTVSWTSSIARHCRNGRLAEAGEEFLRMRASDVEPNDVTFVTLFSGCADFPSEALRFGVSLHGLARKLGLDRNNVKVGTAVVDMYCKCGCVEYGMLCFDGMEFKNKVSWNTMIDGYTRSGEFGKAVELFDKMPERDAVSWTALINGFVRKGRFEQAFVCFREMQLSGVEPDHVTIVSLLSACANLGAIGIGMWINRFLLKTEFRRNVRVNNSLIDMYSRCGCVDLAFQTFKNIRKRSLVTWNSMIVGFAMNGHAEEALECFSGMHKDGFKPDGVSFTGALTACSHSGLLDEGLELFKAMKSNYKIAARIEHYGCIVDLFSRAGRLEEALNVVKNLPMKPNEVVLGSLLAACRNHGDVTLAERVMNCLNELNHDGDYNYVLLSNIYAAAGSWRGASVVRRKMKACGIRKKPGISSIEIDCIVHQFVSGDKSHVDSYRIYQMLKNLAGELRISGYIPKQEKAGEFYDSD